MMQAVYPGALAPYDIQSMRYEVEQLAMIRPFFLKIRERQAGSYTWHTVPARLQRYHTNLPSFDRVLSLPIVRDTANSYLGPGWGIATYIGERIIAGDGVLYPAHRDEFDGYPRLKVYVYLNDIDESNGAIRIEGKPIVAPAGTILFFDPRREHGGGAITSGERIIARAHLVPWRYVLKHLPEQLPWRWRGVSWMWKVIR